MMSTSAALSRTIQRRPARDAALRARDERLEALRTVAGKLGHDFNNFLVPQFGYLTLLKEEIPAGSQALQYANMMESAARKSEGYIESILMGMRPHRQFSPREFSFDELLRQAIRGWKAELPSSLAIDVREELQAFTMFGDEKQWRNALTHILSNARYALATGGTLEVRLQEENLSGPEVLRLGVMTDEVMRLTIRDNGFGMTAEVAERAFEPFFTTRAFIKAAGLGLTIVHSVTQFHGGQVELTTAPDEGTTITLWLPKPGARSPERLASVGGSLFSSSKPKKKVLLIEDDPLVKEVLRAWVMGCELELHSTENAASALRLVHRDPEQWVLAICETQLKGGTGADIRSELQATLPHVDWIFLANKNESSPRSADGTGSKEPLVLRKPFSHKAFIEIVRKYVPA